jgi:GNAT superfamily N-acetyltransferase
VRFKNFYLTESKKLIGYHSTNSKFESFDHKFTGRVGFYFTPEEYFERPEHKNSTLDYSKGKKYTLKCELTIKNPIPNDVFVDIMAKSFGGNPRKMAIEQFKELGYDGYIATAQIWVFDPEQIKILNFVYNKIDEMASLNSISDEKDNDRVFNEILTKNHVGYSDPKEKFNYDGILWAFYGKGLFVGFDKNLIHPNNAMIITLVDFRNKWKFPLVTGIETKEKYRNKGLATKIHEYFIKKYGGFITDDSLSYSEDNGGIYFVYKKLIQKYPSYEISPNHKIIKKLKTLPEPKELQDMDNMNMFLVSKEELGDEWNELDESEDVGLANLQKTLKEKYNLQELYLIRKNDDLILDTIIVSKKDRKQGVGTSVMKEICKYADENKMRILLTAAVKDDFHGTTSNSRLKSFYKRFGFVENKGRNKDFSTRYTMIRPVGAKLP